MDKEIYSLIKKRSEKGMELLINEYAPLIKAIVKKHLYNFPQYHEECINDVYLKIWNNITSFDKEKNILKKLDSCNSKVQSYRLQEKIFKNS